MFHGTLLMHLCIYSSLCTEPFDYICTIRQTFVHICFPLLTYDRHMFPTILVRLPNLWESSTQGYDIFKRIKPCLHTLSDSRRPCDFHYFLCRTLKLFQGKIPLLFAISKICDSTGAIFKTNVIKCFILFEEIIACLTCRWARLFSQVAIIVASSNKCQTMHCKIHGNVV